MSSSDRCKRRWLAVGVVAALAAVSACTARPLHADLTPTDDVAVQRLANLQGRIAVSEVDRRTDQIVRNELLSRLNQGTPVTDPLYAVQLDVSGLERGVQIETGGVPRSAIYQLNVRYSLVRLADNQVIDEGTRQIITPFDRTEQLFQSQRAVLDARQQAGREAAAQIEIAISSALRQTGV